MSSVWHLQSLPPDSRIDDEGDSPPTAEQRGNLVSNLQACNAQTSPASRLRAKSGHIFSQSPFEGLQIWRHRSKESVNPTRDLEQGRNLSFLPSVTLSAWGTCASIACTLSWRAPAYTGQLTLADAHALSTAQATYPTKWCPTGGKPGSSKARTGTFRRFCSAFRLRNSLSNRFRVDWYTV